MHHVEVSCTSNKLVTYEHREDVTHGGVERVNEDSDGFKLPHDVPCLAQKQERRHLEPHWIHTPEQHIHGARMLRRYGIGKIIYYNLFPSLGQIQ